MQSSRNMAYASNASDPAATRPGRKPGWSSSNRLSWIRLKFVWPASRVVVSLLMRVTLQGSSQIFQT